MSIEDFIFPDKDRGDKSLVLNRVAEPFVVFLG